MNDSSDMHLRSQLRLLLKYSGLTAARLYTFDRVNRCARLLMVEAANQCYESLDKWKPFHEIPFNFSSIFHPNEVNESSFLDLLGKARINNNVLLVKNVNSLKDIPYEVKTFQIKNKITDIVVSLLVTDDGEYLGHIVADMLPDNSKEICANNFQLYSECFAINSGQIIDLIRKKELSVIEDNVDSIVDIIKSELDEKSETLNKALTPILKRMGELCGEIDLIQIKQILPEKRFKYIAIWHNDYRNKNYCFSAKEKDKMSGFINRTFLLDEKTGITKLAIMKQGEIFVPNLICYREILSEEFEKYGDSEILINKKSPADDERSFIVRRNFSEINLPLSIGGKMYAIMDIHGRWPYSLNENTRWFVNYIASWLPLLFKLHENDLETAIDPQSVNIEKIMPYEHSVVRAGGRIDRPLIQNQVIYQIGNVNYISCLRDMFVNDSLREFKLRISDAQKQNLVFINNALVGAISTKKISLTLFLGSVATLPPYYLLGELIVNPYIAWIGVISTPFIYFMGVVAEKSKSSQFDALVKQIEASNMKQFFSFIEKKAINILKTEAINKEINK